MEIRVLYIAEIIGKPGIQCVKNLLPGLKRKYNTDLVIANVDSATNGNGIGKNHAGYIHKLGVDVLTGGDMIYFKKDLVEDFSTMTYVLRPGNFPVESPGRFFKICNLKNGVKVAVVSMLGHSGFNRVHGDNPFIKLPEILERLKRDTNFIIIDYHGATTAEKKTFAFYADGLVSAVIGSHGKVQTADERVLPHGTVAITDAGRTGCINSVGGCNALACISEYISGIPNWTHVAEATPENRPELQGVFFVLDSNSGSSRIERVQVPFF